MDAWLGPRCCFGFVGDPAWSLLFSPRPCNCFRGSGHPTNQDIWDPGGVALPWEPVSPLDVLAPGFPILVAGAPTT